MLGPNTAALWLIAVSLFAAETIAGEPPKKSPSMQTLGSFARLCDRKDPTSTAACGSFIIGFVAGTQAMRDAVVVKITADNLERGNIAPSDSAIEAEAGKLNREFGGFCIRSPWTTGYVQAVIVQYAREHPGELGEPLAQHMLRILTKAFPC